MSRPRYPWEGDPDQGGLAARCSCGQRVEGTRAELITWARAHDDAPGRLHVVNGLYGEAPEPAAEWAAYGGAGSIPHWAAP